MARQKTKIPWQYLVRMQNSWNLYTLIWGKQNTVPSLENNLAVSYKFKYISYNPGTSLLCIYSKEMRTYVHKDLQENAYSSFTQKSWQTKIHPNFHELMNDQILVHLFNETTLFSSKRNKLLPHTTAWMNLKSIMLCEKGQTQKVVCSIIPFLQLLERCIRQRNQICGCSGGWTALTANEHMKTLGTILMRIFYILMWWLNDYMLLKLRTVYLKG